MSREPIDLSRGPVALGRHVLLATLGRGGMSVVYAAYDEALDRKVAVKVLRSGTTMRRLRLRREAQVLAQLTHPNVVRVYEICEFESLDYIVMELVDGVTLATWCRQRREPAEILRVFLAAGRGLAAAHDKGIVHRDFKPENAMVRHGDGQVLVMDFGLARDDRVDSEDADAAEQLDDDADAEAELDSTGLAEDGPSGSTPDPVSADPRAPSRLGSSRRASRVLTQVGAVMGTVGYMAPEQVRGRVADPRSDQFSFCASLWEALFGARPFKGSHSLSSYRSELLAGRLQAPSRGEVPAWIVAVLQRGLEIDPVDRYPSMHELLDALERDPTRGRRRRLITAALVTALVGLVGAVWGTERHAQNRERARCEATPQSLESTWSPAIALELERVFAATEDPTAASAWAATRPWLDSYADELARLRRANCLAERIEHSRSPQKAAQIAACLDDSQASFAALIDVLHETDAGMLQHAAEAATTLPLLSDCTDERRQAGALRPPPELQTELRDLQRRLDRAEALRQIGELEPAFEQAEAVLAQAEALDWAPVVAEALLILSELHVTHSRWELADAAAGRAFRKAAVAGASIAMIEASVQLTALNSAAGRLELAERWRETATELIRNAGLDASLIAGELAVVEAGIEITRGDLDEAEQLAEQALAILEALLGADHPGLGGAMSALSTVLTTRHEYEQARAITERQLDIYLRAYGPDNVQLIGVYNRIGAALQLTDRPAEAADYYRRALALAERTLGPEHLQAGILLFNLGLLAYEIDYDLEVSRGYFERALAILEASLDPRHPKLLKPLVNLGTIASRRGEHEAAILYFHRAVAILDGLSEGEADTRDLWVRASFADALVRMGDHDAAEVEYEHALRSAEAIHGPEHPQVIRSLLGLAEVAIARGELDEGATQLARAEASMSPELERRRHFEVIEAQLAWARGDRDRAVARLLELRAEAEAEGNRFATADIDGWLASHGPSADPARDDEPG